jgi:hypothetical protein
MWDRNSAQAGSAAVSRWLRLSSRTRRLSGIRAASPLAWAAGTRVSLRECRIRGRASDLRREGGHVDAGELLEEADPVGRRGGLTLERGEVVPVLRGAVGQELRGEDLQEAGVLVCPADAGQVQVDGRCLSFVVSAGLDGPSSAVGSGEDQPADPLRVPGRIRDRHGAALRDTEQREPVESHRIDHGFQIVDPVVEGAAGNGPVGQSAAAFVVAEVGSSRLRILAADAGDVDTNSCHCCDRSGPEADRFVS